MPNLPKNLVKPPPAFDNPLRATSRPQPIDPPVGAHGSTDELEADVIALPVATADAATTKGEGDGAEIDGEYRLSVRIPMPVYIALQTEIFENRIRGKKTTMSDLARDLLEAWADRKARRSNPRR
jgi:hypothetical protein